MKSVRILYIALIISCLTILPRTLIAQQGAAPEPTVDLGGFTKEIMQFKVDSNFTELVMWTPLEFFVESSVAGGMGTGDEVAKDLAYLEPYVIMIAQTSIIQLDGSALYSTEEEVRRRAVLLTADGTEILPVEDVPPFVAATMAAIKVIFASEGDPGGKNLHTLVFPDKDKQGKPIVDTSKKDKLTLVLKPDGPFQEAVFTWHTPFDAMTSVPPCSKCGESVSAKWGHCPWCGAELSK